MNLKIARSHKSKVDLDNILSIIYIALIYLIYTYNKLHVKYKKSKSQEIHLLGIYINFVNNSQPYMMQTSVD